MKQKEIKHSLFYWYSILTLMLGYIIGLTEDTELIKNWIVFSFFIFLVLIWFLFYVKMVRLFN